MVVGLQIRLNGIGLLALPHQPADYKSAGTERGRRNREGAPEQRGVFGYEAIKRKRLFCPQGRELEETLELSNIILTLADDLYTSCIISEYDPIDTPEKRQ